MPNKGLSINKSPKEAFTSQNTPTQTCAQILSFMYKEKKLFIKRNKYIYIMHFKLCTMQFSEHY